jgi:hypothetical protein
MVGVEKVAAHCSINPTDLSFLGPGVPLFFLFLKSAIILLLMMLVIFSAFALYSNIMSNDCLQNDKCSLDSFNTLSIVNKENNQDFLSIQAYLSLLYVVLSVAFFQVLRLQARRLEQECDEIVSSPSDYAIVLRQLPKNIIEDDI